jgi:geranylgeranyl reductase family protein
MPLSNDESTFSDIVVVGAGPGGCATSLFLAKYGIKHTVLEKAVFPRDKVCGDAVSGKCLAVLRKLSPDIAKEFESKASAFQPCWGIKFTAPNGKSIDIPFKLDLSKVESPLAFVSKRYDFDNELFERLDTRYAQVIQGAEVVEVQRANGAVSVSYVQAGKTQRIEGIKVVVGAEGDRSVVAKKLSTIKMEKEHYCAGLRIYYEGIRDVHPQQMLELFFLQGVLPGYLWIFHLPNGHANVGIGMLSSEISKRKVNLKEVLEKALAEDPLLKARFSDAKPLGKVQGWGLPLGSKKRPISGDNYLLTGDAASLIDPFSGEGIGNALYSGMLAAETIAKAFASGRFDAEFFKQYDQQFYERQWNELQLSHRLQKLTKYGWMFNFVVNKANKNKTLRETMITMFDDIDLRAKLRNPLFYLKLLIND